MRLLYDQNMPLVDHFFGDLGLTLVPFAGRQLAADRLLDDDIVLVRSVTRVDAQLLAQAKPSFVGTATIGMDHLDQPYLQQRRIAYANAPGCNAAGVVDYVLASLLLLYLEKGLAFWQQRIAIVGVGNVGGALAARLSALGVTPLLVDPFRAESEPGFVTLDQALAQADVLCLHTPLTRTGRYPTHGLLGTAQWAQMRPGCTVINAGRGEIIVAEALLEHWPRLAGHLILDVWPQEPQVDDALLQLCYLATPHIAGYSAEGKGRGTHMLYQQLAKRHGWPDKPMPLPQVPWQALEVQPSLNWAGRAQLLLSLYHPRRDDSAMRAALYGLPLTQRAAAFDRLRKGYQERLEWSSYPWQALDNELSALIGRC